VLALGPLLEMRLVEMGLLVVVLVAVLSCVYDRLYISIYGPPSDPCAKKVIFMECDTPGCSPVCEKRIAGVAVLFCDPIDASTRTPKSPSIDTFPIPQRGFIVACQYIAVPGKTRDTDEPMVVVNSYTPDSCTVQEPSKCIRESCVVIVTF